VCHLRLPKFIYTFIYFIFFLVNRLTDLLYVCSLRRGAQANAPATSNYLRILKRTVLGLVWRSPQSSGARFTKYLTTILRLSYDNAIATID